MLRQRWNLVGKGRLTQELSLILKETMLGLSTNNKILTRASTELISQLDTLISLRLDKLIITNIQ